MSDRHPEYGEALNRAETRYTELVLSGLGPRKIADELGITEQVVKNALRKAYVKLGVHSANELLAEAHKQQALLLWTGKRGYYPEDAPAKPVTSEPAKPVDWLAKFKAKPTPIEIKVASVVLEFNDLKTHFIARAVETEPHTVHSAMVGLFRKAGVNSRAGLIQFLQTP